MADTISENSGNLQAEQAGFFQVREIQPATLPQIEGEIAESYDFAAGADKYDYGRGRGSRSLFVPGKDHAELPGFAGESPREIVESLPPGSRILDVGCGYGQIGAEIVGKVRQKDLNDPSFDGELDTTEETPAINSTVEVYGFDAQAQKGQDRLDRMAIGNVDALSPHLFGDHFEGFELIISSALLYHLPDYWGALVRMANLLKSGGILLTSSVPRVVSHPGSHRGVENAKGYLHQPDDGKIAYFLERNVWDISGRLIPPGEVIDILNAQNTHFRLEYRVASAPILGSRTHGGQISGQRLSPEGNLDLSSMYYSFSKGALGYILARSEEERRKLESAGYINVSSRLHANT